MFETVTCRMFGGCYIETGEWETYRPDRYHLLSTVNVSFFPPQWAEPQPSPERLLHAEAILECDTTDFERTEEVVFLTSPGQAWIDGSPIPDGLLALAETGDAQAQWEIAFGLISGQTGETSRAIEEEGFAWMLRAAGNGHLDALNEVGAAHLYGYFYQDIDFDRSREFLARAADQGDPLAMLSLATMPPRSGQSLEIYASERLDYELQSARSCYRDAAILVAARLRQAGRGFEMNHELANAILDQIVGDEVVERPAL